MSKFVEQNESNRPQANSGAQEKGEHNLLNLISSEKSAANLLKAETKPNLVGDFAYGVLDGSVGKPVSALRQLAGKTDVTTSQDKSTAQTIGEIAGTALPFIAVSALTNKGSSLLFGDAAQKSVFRAATEQGVAGFVLGSVLTPSELKADQNLFAARLKQGFHDSAIFATMGGTANLLSKNMAEASSFGAKLGQRMVVGGGSGAAAGLVDAEVRAGGQASWSDLAVSMSGYALMGAAFEGGGLAIQSLAKPQNQSRILRGSVTEAMASDPQTTIISSFAGWYDNLNRAIRKAPKDHTIIVTQEKWASEGLLMTKSLKRPDVKIVLDKDASASAAKAADLAGKASERTKLAERAAKPDATPDVEKVKNLPSWELSRYLQQEAEKHGKDAVETVIAELKKNRLVIIGEYHVHGSGHNEWAANSLMPKLKGKATHFAVENDADIKLFKADGKVDFNALPELHQHREYAAMLQAAKDNGMKVAPIDVPSKFGSRELLDRNRHMTEQLLKILEDKDASVVFWVGNKHLRLNDSGDGPQVVQMLRERGIKLSTFYGQHDNFYIEEPMRRMYTPRSPLAVPTKDTPVISSLNWLRPDEHGHKIHRFSEFDFILMQPEKRAPHFD